MKSRYYFIDENYPYFITSTIVEWLPVFTNAKYCNIITDSLKFCKKQGKFKIHAFVILDNHIHLIISGTNLAKQIKEFKSFTAREIVKQLKLDNKEWLLNQFAFFRKKYKTESTYQIWQEGVHPKMIQSHKMFKQKIEYIHNNPVRKGLVDIAEHWVYSSARNYCLEKGIMNVDFVEDLEEAELPSTYHS